jgi:retinol dehydrogenase-12
LIIGVRTVSKGEAAKAAILKSNPSSKTDIDVWLLEMESFDSVLAFGKRAQELEGRMNLALSDLLY